MNILGRGNSEYKGPEEEEIWHIHGIAGVLMWLEVSGGQAD